MSSVLLAKLKVKPAPKPKTSVEVVMPVAAKKEAVSVKTVIVDKRGENLIDREAILAKIRGAKIKTPEATVVAAKIPSPVAIAEINPPLPETIPKPKTKTKKIKQKLKLVVEPEAVEEQEVIAEPERVAQPAEVEAPLTIKVKKKRTEKLKIVQQEGPLSMMVIGDTPIGERIPAPKAKVLIRASDYYLNNRQIFVNFISSLFAPYKQQLVRDKKTFSCKDRGRADKEFSLLTHQNIVRDYINLYTPYRGLLLYHGLGSGKTCSSIAIAEGMKSSKQIIVMTPASLRRNYIEQLKDCGDSMFRKNQYWEFVDTRSRPELIGPLSQVMSLSAEYITRQGGVFLVNIKKPSNFDELDSSQKLILDNQLNEMIRYKYRFINYNGLRNETLKTLTENYTINPFDNKVVIIDEAHNFVSRIVNKLGKGVNLSTRMYGYLMNAENFS